MQLEKITHKDRVINNNYCYSTTADAWWNVFVDLSRPNEWLFCYNYTENFHQLKICFRIDFFFLFCFSVYTCEPRICSHVFLAAQTIIYFIVQPLQISLCFSPLLSSMCTSRTGRRQGLSHWLNFQDMTSWIELPIAQDVLYRRQPNLIVGKGLTIIWKQLLRLGEICEYWFTALWYYIHNSELI